MLKPTKRILFLLMVAASLRLVVAQSDVDEAFGRFWDAKDARQAAEAAAGVVASGVTFDEALARLKKGRTYSADVPRGVVRASHKMGDAEFLYTLDVPTTYEPSTPHQVRFQLHGGVGRPENTVRGNGSIGSLAGAAHVPQIYVLPVSWADAQWWGDAQLASVRTILDLVKRSYNVDEDRVVMSGVSDGGTGAFYFAMRDTTPFAAFLPLNGFIMILANPSMGLGEPLFPHNLLNKPFFVVNGGKDPLYPASEVEPYLRHLQKGGVSIDYRPQPNGAHNTAWWPEMREPFEAFVRSHPRDPHPPRITWEAEAGAFARAHWLVIDEVGTGRAAKPLADVNEFPSGRELNFGVRVSGMRITAVMAGSNAAAIGLEPDDWVLSINGRSLPGGLDLLEFLSLYAAGDRLKFGISRDNKPFELTGVFNPQPMTRMVPLFPRGGRSGRVDLVRDGNTVGATTRGVRAFTLLASPDSLDFTQPVTVVADGRTVFSGRLVPSVATLLKWAAIDNDRTMLYGAEIPVRLD